MAERKEIFRLSIVTDTETGQEQIGDIEGGYVNEEELKRIISVHGADKLIKALANAIVTANTLDHLVGPATKRSRPSPIPSDQTIREEAVVHQLLSVAANETQVAAIKNE